MLRSSRVYPDATMENYLEEKTDGPQAFSGASEQVYGLSGLQANSVSRHPFEGILVVRRKRITRGLGSPESPVGRGLRRTSAALQLLLRAAAINCEQRRNAASLASARLRPRRETIDLFRGSLVLIGNGRLQAQFGSSKYCLRPIVNTECLEGSGQVCLDGAFGDFHLPGNDLVRFALDSPHQHI